jgi:hypothetical protein
MTNGSVSVSIIFLGTTTSTTGTANGPDTPRTQSHLATLKRDTNLESAINSLCTIQYNKQYDDIMLRKYQLAFGGYVITHA